MVWGVKVPLVGAELPPRNKPKTQDRRSDSAPDSAFPGALRRVIDAWPRLSEAALQDILDLVDAAADTPQIAYDASGRDEARKADTQKEVRPLLGAAGVGRVR